MPWAFSGVTSSPSLWNPEADAEAGGAPQPFGRRSPAALLMRSVVDRIPDAGVSADGLLRGDFAHLSSPAFGLSGIPEGAGEDFCDGPLRRRSGRTGD